MVPMFITAAPAGSPWTTPRSPKRTSWTASALVSIRMVARVSEAASAGESARWAPASIRGSTLSGLLLHTASSWPALSRFLAIGAPMAPSPMNPSFICFLTSFGKGWRYLQELLSLSASPFLALRQMVGDKMGDHGRSLAEVESPYFILGGAIRFHQSRVLAHVLGPGSDQEGLEAAARIGHEKRQAGGCL